MIFLLIFRDVPSSWIDSSLNHRPFFYNYKNMWFKKLGRIKKEGGEKEVFPKKWGRGG